MLQDEVQYFVIFSSNFQEADNGFFNSQGKYDIGYRVTVIPFEMKSNIPINSILLLVVAKFEGVKCVDISNWFQIFDVMFYDMGT
jgi:hypothetical protein